MPGNPYQYTGKGEGFLTDYSNLDAAGSAIQGFVGAYNDAQDRSMKRMEHEANLEAVKQKMMRERDQSQIEAYKSGASLDQSTGQVTERPLSTRENEDRELKSLGEGYKPDPTNPGHFVLDKTSPKYLTAVNSGLRGQATMERLDETRNQNAIKAGHDIENDAVMKDMTTARYSLSRGKKLLDGKLPLTYNNLNAVQQDIISGMTKGGQSSEGKVSREMQASWLGRWNNVMAEAGKYGPENDIRVQDPGLYHQIQGLLNEVDGTIAQNMADRTKKLSTNYSQSTNKKVQNTIKQKLEQYAAPEEPASSGMVTPGLVAPPPQGLVKGQSVDPATAAKLKRIKELEAKAAGG